MRGIGRINQAITDTALGNLLGADGVTELRSKLIDTIVDIVRQQLEEYSTEFIITPEDIYSVLQEEVINAAVEEVKEEYKEYVSELMKEKLDTIMKNI